MSVNKPLTTSNSEKVTAYRQQRLLISNNPFYLLDILDNIDSNESDNNFNCYMNFDASDKSTFTETINEPTTDVNATMDQSATSSQPILYTENPLPPTSYAPAATAIQSVVK